MDEWMDGWMDGWIDPWAGQTDRWMEEVRSSLDRHIPLLVVLFYSQFLL